VGEEEMRAIKFKVISLPSTSSSNPRFVYRLLLSTNDTLLFFSSDTITEEKVHNLLLHKHMTFTELIQKFLPKMERDRTKEMKDGIVQKLATILKKLNIEEKIINGKKHIELKS
jgi:hypothetical protein